MLQSLQPSALFKKITNLCIDMRFKAKPKPQGPQGRVQEPEQTSVLPVDG